MGKFATYQKRGSMQRGFLSGPPASEFTLTGVTATTATVTWTGALPPQATSVRIRSVRADSGSLGPSTVSPSPIVLTGMTTGVTYRLYAEYLGTAPAANTPISPFTYLFDATPV